jgi:hypothetical protein
MKDNNYWNTALPTLRDALNGIPFDTKNFQGLLVGRSVTEWEVKSAFQSAGVVNGADTMVIPEYLREKAIWSHRQFINGVSDAEDEKKEYCDVKGNEQNTGYLRDLKTWMTSAFLPDNVKTYSDVSPGLTVTNMKNSGSDQNKDLYMNSFKDYVESKLKASLRELIVKKQSWLKDAGGLGVDGGSVSEMLHHCYFVYDKVSHFYGRDELIEQALTMIESNNIDNKYGICLSLIGVSGAGKTAMMSKLAEHVEQRLGTG